MRSRRSSQSRNSRRSGTRAPRRSKTSKWAVLSSAPRARSCRDLHAGRSRAPRCDAPAPPAARAPIPAIDAVARVSGQGGTMMLGSGPLGVYFRDFEAMEFAVMMMRGGGARRGGHRAAWRVAHVEDAAVRLPRLPRAQGRERADREGDRAAERVYELDPAKIVGLTVPLTVRGARGAQSRREQSPLRGADGGLRRAGPRTAVQRRLGCPVIDISELSIEETAQRYPANGGGRKAEGPRPPSRDPEAALVALGHLVGLPRPGPGRLLRPADAFWIGLRGLAWLAEFPRRRRRTPDIAG